MKASKLFAVFIHQKVVQYVRVLIHEAVHDLESSHFRDRVIIWHLLERRQEVEYDHLVGSAEAKTFRLLFSSLHSFSIVACDIRVWCWIRIAEPIATVVLHLQETAVAWGDLCEPRAGSPSLRLFPAAST